MEVWYRGSTTKYEPAKVGGKVFGEQWLEQHCHWSPSTFLESIIGYYKSLLLFRFPVNSLSRWCSSSPIFFWAVYEPDSNELVEQPWRPERSWPFMESGNYHIFTIIAAFAGIFKVFRGPSISIRLTFKFRTYHLRLHSLSIFDQWWNGSRPWRFRFQRAWP